MKISTPIPSRSITISFSCTIVISPGDFDTSIFPVFDLIEGQVKRKSGFEMLLNLIVKSTLTCSKFSHVGFKCPFAAYHLLPA